MSKMKALIYKGNTKIDSHWWKKKVMGIDRNKYIWRKRTFYVCIMQTRWSDG